MDRKNIFTNTLNEEKSNNCIDIDNVSTLGFLKLSKNKYKKEPSHWGALKQISELNKVYNITDNFVTIGTANGSDICLISTFVSSKHCIIIKEKRTVYLIDTSFDGTF